MSDLGLKVGIVDVDVYIYIHTHMCICICIYTHTYRYVGLLAALVYGEFWFPSRGSLEGFCGFTAVDTRAIEGPSGPLVWVPGLHCRDRGVLEFRGTREVKEEHLFSTWLQLYRPYLLLGRIYK